MPQKLPKGWITTRLGDVCLPVEKVQLEAAQDYEFTYFDIGSIENNVVAATKSIEGRNLPS